MPKKKKGKKGKGKKGKGKLKAAGEKEELIKKTKDVLKAYPVHCINNNSSVGSIVFSALKQCVEDEKPLVKAVLDQQRSEAKIKIRKDVLTQPAASAADVSSAAATSMGPSPVKLSPLLRSLLEHNYVYLRCIHAWQIYLNEEETVELAKFMESKLGHEIRVLEIISNNISTWSLSRLCRTFPANQLVNITLDYNKIDHAGIQCLCANLLGNLHLNSLNLNYCNLPASSGSLLGTLVTSTQIRYLGLRGNKLRAIGVKLLLQSIVSVSETMEKMPLLHRLFLQDNEIDECVIGGDGIHAPIRCMEMMKRWLVSCKTIEEVRLDGNLIGEVAAREVLLGLKSRKEAGHSPVQLSLTHCISSDLFMEIYSLTAAKGRKKGKAKKKGKKKK